MTSSWNLWGMSLALVGTAGVLGGVIASGWPFIVGGLYVLGVLIDVARPRSPSLPSLPSPVQPVPTRPQPDPDPAPVPDPPSPVAPDNHLGIEGLSDLKVIGRGGFSTVYSGRERGFDRLVAVKVLHDLDQQGRRWFDRERSVMGRLSGHPHIITPFRLGLTRDDAPYMIMEFVAGGSLDDRLDRTGPLPWPEAVRIGLDVCDALDHAHQAGVLHRDVKPANILMTGRGAKLTDFGISSLRGATATAGETALSLAHSPPEAFDRGLDRRDERSDVYSLASTLYTLIVGRAPFDLPGGPSGPVPDSTVAYLQRIASIEVTPLPQDLGPPALDALIRRALAKDSDDRPPTARALGDGLAAIADGNQGPSPTQCGSRW